MLFVEVSWPQSDGVCSQVHGLLCHNNEKTIDIIFSLSHISTWLTYLAELGAIVWELILAAHQYDPTFVPFLTQSLSTGNSGRSCKKLKWISSRQKNLIITSHDLTTHPRLRYMCIMKPYHIAGRHTDMTEMYHMLEAGMLYTSRSPWS